jgi:hypothetical protein
MTHIAKLIVITLLFKSNAFAAYYISDPLVYVNPSQKVYTVAYLLLCAAIFTLLTLCILNTVFLLKESNKKILYYNILLSPIYLMSYFLGYYLLFSNVIKKSFYDFVEFFIFEIEPVVGIPEFTYTYEFWNKMLLAYFILSLLCAVVALPYYYQRSETIQNDRRNSHLIVVISISIIIISTVVYSVITAWLE